MTKEERGVRSEIEGYMMSRIDEMGTFRLPDLVDETLAHFTAKRGFAQQFVRAMARTTIHFIGIQLISNRRRGRVGDIVINPDDLAGAEKLAQPKAITRWLDQHEHCGDVFVPRRDLTKPMGLTVMGERTKRISAEWVEVELIKRLIKPLKRDQTIGDRWSEAEVQTIRTGIKEAVNGNLRREGQAIHDVQGEAPIPKPPNGRRAKRPKSNRGMAAG